MHDADTAVKFIVICLYRLPAKPCAKTSKRFSASGWLAVIAPIAFKACPIAHEIKQDILSQRARISHPAGGIFVYGADHVSGNRGAQQMSARFQQLRLQRQISLLQTYAAVVHIHKLCSQISRNPALFPVYENTADTAREPSPAKRNIRHGQHDAVAIPCALRPDITLRKGCAPVSLQISAAILDVDIFTVYSQPAIHLMM